MKLFQFLRSETPHEGGVVVVTSVVALGLSRTLVGVVGGPRRRDYSAPPAVFGLSHSRRHWTRFEVYTHNLQGSSQSKQRAVEYSQFTGK